MGLAVATVCDRQFIKAAQPINPANAASVMGTPRRAKSRKEMLTPNSRAPYENRGAQCLVNIRHWRVCIKKRARGSMNSKIFSNSVIGKIERSRHHLNALESEVRTFIESEPYVIRHEVNTDTNEKMVVFHPTRSIPSPLPYILGDLVNKLAVQSR
jgi:hypothetical protein